MDKFKDSLDEFLTKLEDESVIVKEDKIPGDLQHAKFSASGSSKWLNCPGSIKAEENIESVNSAFSTEGTLAHIVAENYVNGVFPDYKNIKGFEETTDASIGEMTRHAHTYSEYIKKHRKGNTRMFIEKKVDFSHIAPNAFGTLDCCIYDVDNKICHVIDFKYGRGIPVEVENNTQLMLYAIGMQKFLKQCDYSINEFVLHIYQPRVMNGINRWNISANELDTFASVARKAAELAKNSDAKRIPGKLQCRWCRAKGQCNVLKKYTLDCIVAMGTNEMTREHEMFALEKGDLLVEFLNSVKQEVRKKMLNGIKYEGYKLVRSRSVRRWQKDSVNVLKSILNEKAFVEKIISITEAKKAGVCDSIIEDLTYKNEGHLILVKSSDKRKESVVIGFENQDAL